MIKHRDYQKKDFNNPLFSRKIKSGFTGKIKWFIAIFIFLVISLYFFNKTNYLMIDNIEIIGNEYISQQDIKEIVNQQMGEKRLLFFNQNNLIFFSKKAAKASLASHFFFDNININKKYPETLVIKVEEKISSLIWSNNSGKYYLDLEGNVIRQITADNLVISEGEGDTEVIRSEINSGRYPVIQDQSNSEIITGQPILAKDRIDFIIELTKKIKSQADFSISYYTLASPSINYITLITDEGWLVHFSFENQISNQINLLFSLLYQKIDDRSKLEYIDLRFGDKIFWK